MSKHRFPLARKAAAAIGALACALPAFAHHSFTMFDFSKPTSIEGVVTSFQWQNPHAYMEIDVPKDGKTVHYSIEMSGLGVINKLGWKHNTVKPGDQIKMLIFPLRNGKNGGSMYHATVPDGRTLGNGFQPDVLKPRTTPELPGLAP